MRSYLDEAVHLAAPGLAVLDGFTGLVVLRLRRFIPADQFVVVPVIIILVLRNPGVLGYEPAVPYLPAGSSPC